MVFSQSNGKDIFTKTLSFFRFNVLNSEEEASILASFLMSGFWHKNTRFQIRPISKMSFNSLAFLFLGAATYFAKKSPESDPRLDQNSRLYEDSKSDLHGCWNATEILISQSFDCIDLCYLNSTKANRHSVYIRTVALVK